MQQIIITNNSCEQLIFALPTFFSNKSFPARLKATTRQEASRRDRTDFTKTEKDTG